MKQEVAFFVNSAGLIVMFVTLMCGNRTTL